MYLVATLRSFRGVGGAQMVRHGQSAYFVGAGIVGQGTFSPIGPDGSFSDLISYTYH